MTAMMIEAEGLRKRFGTTQALDHGRAIAEGTAAEPVRAAWPPPRSPSTPRRPAARGSGRLRDVAVLTMRNFTHIRREPLRLSDVTIQPILFTLLWSVALLAVFAPLAAWLYKRRTTE